MRRFYIMLLLCCATFSHAQEFQTTITDYFNSKAEELGFNTSDFKSFTITDQSYSKSMNVYNIYVQQAYQDILIKNAIGSFAVKDDRVVNLNHSFIKNIDQKVNSVTSSITPENALNSALSNLDIHKSYQLSVFETLSDTNIVFESEELSVERIPIKLMYIKTKSDDLKLVWDLSLLTKEENHWWNISIDANTGEVLEKNDWILSCNFEPKASGSDHQHTPNTILEEQTLMITNDGSSYRAFPLGVESPNHGSRVLLNEPANSVASPFGWHDTDGVIGPEFTITRGNNVYASEDRNADNVPGFSPDGGTGLDFDYTFNENTPPTFYEAASVTNLFVWNNYNHDLWFRYGFDEVSGNFQETNYTGQGIGGDFVFADAQDGSGLNNANFGTPPDGFNPRMQMFLWSPAGGPSEPLTINSPSAIAGDYQGVEAAFGPGLSPTPITADLALVIDDNSTSVSSDIHNACDPIINGSDLNGKIAVLNRGECTFVEKILSVESEGAIAVIVINNVFTNPISMGGVPNNIGIPSIMISLADGVDIRTRLQNGETINATLVNNGPFEIDGDFDNGIIAHEYGHGISNRLTGGPQQSNCLFNDEQMGEGWSDWLGLMMTMQPGDFAEQVRGIGTFAVSQPTTGGGIRPAPYSTDFTVNSATYDISNNPNIFVPHGIGFVWSTMLWDLTWELIDQYGFDNDLINGNGGNNLAMQLVIDGMKLQRCLPGFIDGRDAILEADQLANAGANQCYIWKVFANRGLGFSATQGSADSRFDQVEAFDLPPDISLPCQELSVNEFDINSIKIFPNPANDLLNIQTVAGSIGKANVKLYDLNGRLIDNIPSDLNQTQQIDISQYQPGLYLLKIENSKLNITKKLIIN